MVVERELGLSRGDVLNLGVTAGTPFDAQHLFHRNRDILSGATVALVGVEDWYVNGAIPPSARERRFATLGQRLETDGHVLPLLAGWAWHTYGAHDVIWHWMRARGRRGADVGVLEDGRLDWRLRSDGHNDPPRVDAERLLGGYQFTQHRMRRALALVESLRRADIDVSVVQIPLHPEYTRLVAEEHEEVGTDFERELRPIVSASNLSPLIWADDSAALGLRANHFRDYGHMTEDGAAVLSARIAHELGSVRCQGD